MCWVSLLHVSICLEVHLAFSTVGNVSGCLDAYLAPINMAGVLL